MSKLHRNKEWRKLLDELMREQGVDLEYVAEYIGAPYNGSETVIYAKQPTKRSRFIGIGMALGQPLSVINQWIRDFSNHHTLYPKDVTEDLIWIYLIGLNVAAGEQSTDSNKKASNYYRMFDECQEAALITYQQLWDEFSLGSLDTADLQIELEKIDYDDTFTGLKQFIIDHMDSFKNAYSKPRRMLDQYLECILAARAHEQGEHAALDSLRGYLDDSMINYLSGDSETIHTMGRRSADGKPVRLVRFKPVPKNRRTHISLCLALGMTRKEIDRYLDLMGYAPIREDGEERILKEALDRWESAKPLQRTYKNACLCHLKEADTGALSIDQQRQAVQEMLYLRRDMQMEYKKRGIAFPFGK